MDLKNKKIKINYTVSNFNKFLTGIVLEDNENFLVVEGSKDGTIFHIAKNTITELIEINGGVQYG